MAKKFLIAALISGAIAMAASAAAQNWALVGAIVPFYIIAIAITVVMVRAKRQLR